MRIQKIASMVLSAALIWGQIPAVPAFAVPAAPLPTVESASIDGFSVKLPEDRTSFTYQYFSDGAWSAPEIYESDGDRGPGEESELIMVPLGTTKVRASADSAQDIHPISVSHEPVKYRVAALTHTGTPPVLSRGDWGADESYTFPVPSTGESSSSTSDTAKGDNGAGKADQRVKDCLEAQKKYSSEFKTASTVTRDAEGRSYSWPLQYSKEVKLLVVHHSALLVQGDPRPAAERVRALYKYHALSNGWGDIGYNFIVDENGQAYEGRQGGTSVVGGHAYCNNVGTIGIVLMGNFELEMPSQAQARGLQSLLDSLAREYGLDVHRSVQFHGKTFDTPIVAHRDLLSTLCPGYSMYGGLPQVVSNVQTGKLDAPVKFLPPKVASSSSSSSSARGVTPSSPRGLAEGISFIGRTSITINPGGKQRLSFTYTAPQSGAYQGKKVAEVQLSTPKITLWQDDGLHQVPITKGILLDSDLPGGESVDLQLIVQAPVDGGTYWMDIAGMHFTLAVSGRRARTGEYINPFSGNPAMIVHPSEQKKPTTVTSRVREQTRPSLQTSSASSSRGAASSSAGASVSDASSPLVRIRLSSTKSPTLTFVGPGSIGSAPVSAGTAVNLLVRGSQCIAIRGGSELASGQILRLQSDSPLTINMVRSRMGSYKGVIECRVVDGTMALINELPMEEYLAGLAEEPDTEPYEKQRAFAIAARTYATFYLQSDQRKFPGKPYDGSDDPATFQSYLGVNFAGDNPSWIRAVASTAGDVLFSGTSIIKPPYFSTDNGRTKTPAEAGWKNFPFAEIFSSKPDPWCNGMLSAGHGVGMSGCGARGQALEGRSAEQILQYYYPGARITQP